MKKQNLENKATEAVNQAGALWFNDLNLAVSTNQKDIKGFKVNNLYDVLRKANSLNGDIGVYSHNVAENMTENQLNEKYKAVLQKKNPNMSDKGFENHLENLEYKAERDLNSGRKLRSKMKYEEIKDKKDYVAYHYVKEVARLPIAYTNLDSAIKLAEAEFGVSLRNFSQDKYGKSWFGGNGNQLSLF